MDHTGMDEFVQVQRGDVSDCLLSGLVGYWISEPVA